MTSGRISYPVNHSPWECPRCIAPSGQPCRYTSAGIHRDPATMQYVDHVPGDPMLITHRQRPRIRCVPLAQSWRTS